jgi:hypothetical protein
LQADQVPTSIANAIDALRQIDFQSMFADSESDRYRRLSDNEVVNCLRQYINEITKPDSKIVDLAMQRVDAPELLDALMTSIYPVEIQDECGKVTTDPELAAILAYLTITEPVTYVIDPCCGDGVLQSAAYDRLVAMGMNHQNALSAIRGIEADPIAARLASVRLALKLPAAVSPEPRILIMHGDMFANASVIGESEVILMNPPFKRYEAQDKRPIPPQLRDYYAQAIQDIDGNPPCTTGGQANLYNLYIEFIAKTMSNGAKAGIILDNKWYHNKKSEGLRGLLLQNFDIEAIIEYPHSIFFSDWTITTSILIIRKVDNPSPDHSVNFVRSKVDPRSVDLNVLVNAHQGNGAWPADWTCRTVLQKKLRADDGWKAYFSADLVNDFRREDWPTLETLFQYSRRGSLEKEGGGIGVLEFPFSRTNYGPRRLRKPPPRNRYQTKKGRNLTRDENRRLAVLAEQIPSDFRGWAVRKADDIAHYELTTTDVEKQQTLEPPRLRAQYQLFLFQRSHWTAYHDAAIDDMRQQGLCHTVDRLCISAINCLELESWSVSWAVVCVWTASSC